MRLPGRLVVLQLEFLLGGDEVSRGLMFLSLPKLELKLACSVTEQVLLTSAQGSISSKTNVRDRAWHKLEIVLRSAGNK